MPLVKCEALFSGQYNDWSETYWGDSSQWNIANPGNLDAVIDRFKSSLLDKRLPLLGKGYGILLARASFPGSGQIAKSKYLYMSAPTNNSAGDPNLTVVVRCGNADNTRVKTIHMRGIWDSIEIEGGIFVGKNDNAWKNFWDGWVGALINDQWGWFGKNVSTRVRISGIVPDDTGFQTITTAADVFTEPAETVLQVRLSKIKGATRLNGAVLVRVVGARECVTLEPWATFPYTGGGFLRKNTQQLIDIANVDASRMGRRDAGKKKSFYAGRQKATPKG